MKGHGLNTPLFVCVIVSFYIVFGLATLMKFK